VTTSKAIPAGASAPLEPGVTVAGEAVAAGAGVAGEAVAGGVDDPAGVAPAAGGAVANGTAGIDGEGLPTRGPQPMATSAIAQVMSAARGRDRRAMAQMLPSSPMKAWELDHVKGIRAAAGRPYHEFLSVPDLSAGLYVLEVGAPDLQQPHTEDELYVVMEGRARVTVGQEVREVSAGSLVFVAATEPHHFHDIVERLVLVVVFGPAEGSRRAGV